MKFGTRKLVGISALAFLAVVGVAAITFYSSRITSGAWHARGNPAFRMMLLESAEGHIRGLGGYEYPDGASLPFIVSGFRAGKDVGLKLDLADAEYSTFEGRMLTKSTVVGSFYQTDREREPLILDRSK